MVELTVDLIQLILRPGEGDINAPHKQMGWCSTVVVDYRYLGVQIKARELHDVFLWCSLLVMKTGTPIYTGIWALWTTKIVGAMQATQKNLMLKQSGF